jgi:hypothetical protein
MGSDPQGAFFSFFLFNEVFPKHQFWENNLRFRGKKRASDRFFQSLSQNQPGFGKGSNIKAK